MKKLIASAWLTLASASAIAAVNFSFQTPVGTTVAVGRLGGTVIADVVTQREEKSSSYAIWVITRVAYHCKLDSASILATNFKVGKPNESWVHFTGSEFELNDHNIPVDAFKQGNVDEYSSNTTFKKSIKKACGAKLDEYSVQIPVSMSAGESKYGMRQVHYFTPTRAKLDGDTREFWFELVQATGEPVLSEEDANKMNFGERGMRLKKGPTLTKGKERVRCSSLQTLNLQYTDFDPDNGKVVAQGSAKSPIKESSYIEESPGSVGEALAKFVCSL